jgi:hypothetical protein
MMLVCCTAICSGGLASEGLFTSPTNTEDVTQLYNTLTTSHCATLIPPGATPQVIAAALKRWLQEQHPEPLLTFKLVPALTSPDTPKEQLVAVIDELPAANRAALLLLLETAHRISSNAAINDTDAATLAAALSPCLLWREGAAVAEAGDPVARAASEVLPVADEAVFVKLLTHMISYYRTLI